MIEKLIEETEIGEYLAISCDIEGEDIDLYIGSADMSTRCGFTLTEWEKFIEILNQANNKYKELKSKK
jgi:hypothetical protein